MSHRAAKQKRPEKLHAREHILLNRCRFEVVLLGTLGGGGSGCGMTMGVYVKCCALCSESMQ